MNSTATMNPSAFHKMVVGAALAVVFGVGVSVFAVRASRDNQVARFAPSALEQSATDVAAPVPSAPAEMSSDPTATAQNAAPAIPPAIAPVPTAPAASNASNDTGGRAVAEAPGMRVAAAARTHKRSADTQTSNRSNNVTSSAVLAPAATPLSDSPSLASAGADAQAAPAQMQEATIPAAPVATSTEPVVSDAQITALVKSEIAAVAPNGNIDVTTANGAVALAGSVASQDAVEQARQAARGVAGVKSVDVSALTVSNQ